ncbi:MAG: molecular chaperone DnaJ [Gaiellaceae bacterium]|nr:molecular chaperone DnaJ [Gaiellaceae bacterium]
MATTERDYYELLRVSRTATDAEIKKAFRALARELHPDVSDHPEAEERFKLVVEAYEVLSKQETRDLYDRYGHAGLRSGGFHSHANDFGNISDLFAAFFGDEVFGGSRQRQGRGADVVAQVEIALTEAATGASREVTIELAETCEHCGGDGAEPGSDVTTCPACNGTGQLQQVSNSLFGQFVRTVACARCRGRGRIVEQACKTCDGAGRVLRERSLQVEIPAGIHDGQRIRLGGEGHAGPPGGAAGDVYVLVRVKQDSRFVREGDDIYATLELTVTQAALGARVSVPTLDGETELDLDAGTQPGQVVVLRGKGMPQLQGFGRGDQRLLVSVLIPKRLDDEQRGLLEQLQAIERPDNYPGERGDEGFFARLKSSFR